MNSPNSGTKRARQSPESPPSLPFPANNNSLSPSDAFPPSALSTNNPNASSSSYSSSSFRNVSACNRCRLRKNRCDQNLPACTSCEKARVKCVGFDPITKREIPRAYVYYLESRVSYLESVLHDHGIAYAPAQDFDLGAKPLAGVSEGSASTTAAAASSPGQERQHHATGHARGLHREPESGDHGTTTERSINGVWDQKQDEADKLNKLVSNIGMVSVQGASDPRYLGSTSGISFARVVFAAVKSSVGGSVSERAGVRSGKPASASAAGSAAAVSGTSMRDSFFGLQAKPATRRAPFPDRELGARLANLYFEHANPQIPILHRGEFMALFDRAYAADERHRSPRELYMLNIVFAIGAGIILGAPEEGSSSPGTASVKKSPPIKREPGSPKAKRMRMSMQQQQPEEYHASAMVHLEFFLGSTTAADRSEGFGGSLEELQAVLLLAGFALLRPVAPGLWYIVGVAVRLAVDLGLHYEDGTGIDDIGVTKNQDVALQAAGVHANDVDAKEKGRREWVRDLRRRLWWCVYSFDRLVSTCVGRPFGITDQVITTEFPSVLDDNYITTSGFTAPPHASESPSYKRVAHHYFRLRLLQSEILQVLQYRQARQAREKGKNSANEFMHTKLNLPFLEGFESFTAWRKDIDRRLWEWKESAPSQKETTVQFSVQFLELNYWQAVIMLYRQSLSQPPELGGEVSPSEEIASPMSVSLDERESDEDVFLKVAEAGQKVLKLYRQLHRVHLVNYTFLATHHLFMAGIAFLYAIWHSATVRSRLTLDDVDFTVLAATSVLGDLIEKCPPAEACRDAFDRMSKATVQMCLSTTGFGSRAPIYGPRKLKTSHSRSSSSPSAMHSSPPPAQPNPSFYQQQPQQSSYVQPLNDRNYFRPQRPRPQFDMNLRDLFPEDTAELRDFSRNLGRWQPTPPKLPTRHTSDSAFMRAQQQQKPSDSSIPQYESTYSPQYAAHNMQDMQNDLGMAAKFSSSDGNVMDAMSDAAYVPNDDLASGSTNQDNVVGDAMEGYDAFSNLPIDLDSLLADTTGQYSGHPGLALGFDNEHDWSEGGGVDFLDGYFFGGVGA